MKVMTIVGTRPEIIRLSRIILALDAAVDHQVVHTGQNWDPLLGEIFFHELGLRPPDHRLSIDTSSLGKVLGGVLAGIEPVLADVRPDAVLVLGDTNSCISAVMAKRMGIPVFHMEAGNRCFDANVPEETNRRLIDHVADYNLCYTEHARRNLLAEGLPARRVFVVGSPLYEVFNAYRDQIDRSDVLARLGVRPQSYLLVSMHREENVDLRRNLETLLRALVELRKRLDVAVVISTHPRLRDRLARHRLDVDASNLQFCPPFGYMDFMRLQQGALCVLSDSGTISEESAMMGFPAVTIRNAMERPEALEAGTILLSGIDVPAIVNATMLALANANGRPGSGPLPLEYQVPDCSVRVTNLVATLPGVHHRWLGVDHFDD